ncbi:VanZ family protein [Peribacillus frigoritolerans]|uniref:VanZ family protein n=1 Tax=Peribacillus castrilensis TaxID=2897690 RepID=UPI002DD37186|nr:VanZ family protein [Peribacillus castrilensis]
MREFRTRLKYEKYINVLFLIYIILLAIVSFWGISPFQTRLNGNIGDVSHNIVPFHTIETYFFNFQHYNFETWFYNTFGTILVFMPLGILLPLVFVNLRNLTLIVLLSLLVSLIIETIQFVTLLGVFDVDDILLNTFGSILGFLIFTLIIKKNKR